MISKYAFTKLIQTMEGIHDLDEQIEQFFGFTPGPDSTDAILSRLYAVEEAVEDVLGVKDEDMGRVREIAGSDMDLNKKVDVLMQLYPGRVDPCT